MLELKRLSSITKGYFYERTKWLIPEGYYNCKSLFGGLINTVEGRDFYLGPV